MIILQKREKDMFFLKKFFKPYAEYCIRSEHDCAVLERRMCKRSISWMNWRNFFWIPDNKEIRFVFKKYRNHIELHPVCGGRNSARGILHVKMERDNGKNITLLHVEIKPDDGVYWFLNLWFAGVVAAMIVGLSGKFILSGVALLMLIFGYALVYYMRKIAEAEIEDIKKAFDNIISDDYITDLFLEM
jgi:hypothetical protein